MRPGRVDNAPTTPHRRLIGTLLAALLLATTGLATLAADGPATANGADQNVRNLQVVTDPDVPDIYSLPVTWDAPISAGVTHYRLDIATTGAGSLPGFPTDVTASAVMADPDVATSPLVVVFTDLQPSSQYTVTVAALAGFDLWPATTVQGSTAAAPPATTPDTPKNLVLTAQQNGIAATWQAPDSDGGSPLTGYRLEVWPPTVQDIELGVVTSHTITGLQQETLYTVNVVAVNAVGPSAATTSAVRTLTPVGLARLGGATASTSASTTTLSASVLNSGRPTSVSRVGFVVSRTDPPLLDTDGVTFVPAPSGLSDTLTATTNAIADDQLYFVRAVLEATYASGSSVSYGPSVPYAASTRTIRFTNLNQVGRIGPSQGLADGFYSAGAGGGSLEHRVTILADEPGIQRYAVEIPGAYRVEAAGAAGGGNGGRGAVVRGTVVFVQDDPLMIAVGQRPSNDETVEGGGGGTFVTRGTTLADAQPLIIAGGGGGGSGLPTQVRDQRAHGRAPAPGEVEAPGQDGGHIRCSRGGILCRSAAGRRGGLGGPVQEQTSIHPTTGLGTASGGGGFLTSGSDSYYQSRDWYNLRTFQGSGGRSFRAGAAGGVQPDRTNWPCQSGCSSLVGGFGGGGSPYRKWPFSVSPLHADKFFGGGGGGYNGGGGGVEQPTADFRERFHNYPEATGGGGGSYNAGLAPEGITGGNADRAAGYVEMRLLAYQPEAGDTDIVGGRAGTTATLTSQVVSTGGDVAVERGFVISQEPDPVLGGPGVQQLRASGVGAGSFSVMTPPMAARTFLYLRSYVRGYGGVGYGPVRTLSTLRPVTFTTAGVTGPQGPTQAQLDTAYAGTPLAGLVQTSVSAHVPQGMQLVTISATGRYRIQALGARGGIALPRGFTTPPGGDRGGRGALVEGVFDLAEGDQLLIVVGQQPGNQVGGGGATFVVKGSGLNDPDLEPLLVAGGGGAVSMPFDELGIVADATAPSGSVTASAAAFVDLSGVDGGGGLGFGAQDAGGRGWAGAGGGFAGDGAPGATGGAVGGAQVGAAGGKAFMNGGEGGEGTTCTGQNGSWVQGVTFTTAGGFGGGGAGAHYFRPNCWSQGGNGGGYNGAGALAPMAMDQYPRIGRGGGSLNTGIFPVGVSGLNDGSGLVHLSYIPPSQPGSLFAAVGAPQAVQLPAGATLARSPGSVLTWRNGVLVQVPTISPATTTTSARTFIDTTVGSATGGLLLDVVEGSGSSGAQIIGLLSQRNSDEPLPVPAGGITGVSTSAGNDEVRMLLAGTDDADQVRLRGNNGEPVAGAGGRISSIITGLPPGTQGEVSLRSTPRLLGTFTVDADGVASFVADVPGDLPAGSHTLVLSTFSGEDQAAVVSVGMTVVPRTATPGGSLPGGLGDLVNAPTTGGGTGGGTPTTTIPPRAPQTTVPPTTTVAPTRTTPPLPQTATPEAIRQRGDELVSVVAGVLSAGVAAPVAVQATPTGAVVSGLLTDPVTGQPMAVPVQNIVMVQGEGTALLLAAVGGDGGAAPLGADGVLQLPPGGRMGAAMAGFTPSSPGQIVLFSDPTLLGQFTTDASGVFAGDVALPADLAPGRHTLVITVGGVSQSLEVVVAAGDVVPGRLPATGQDPWRVLGWVLVLLATGVLLLIDRRRRFSR